eukprot:1180853-Prorocentrum_minimum.AAC.7
MGGATFPNCGITGARLANHSVLRPSGGTSHDQTTPEPSNPQTLPGDGQQDTAAAAVGRAGRVHPRLLKL